MGMCDLYAFWCAWDHLRCACAAMLASMRTACRPAAQQQGRVQLMYYSDVLVIMPLR